MQLFEDKFDENNKDKIYKEIIKEQARSSKNSGKKLLFEIWNLCEENIRKYNLEDKYV